MGFMTQRWLVTQTLALPVIGTGNDLSQTRSVLLLLEPS